MTPSYRNISVRAGRLMLVGLSIFLARTIGTKAEEDRREDILSRNMTCFEYDEEFKTLSLVCSEFDLNGSPEFGNDDYITLKRGETFDGKDNTILLDGITDYSGLFRIAKPENGGSDTLECAPLIQNLHMRGGQTSQGGGFIVKSDQANFIVRSCSSSGMINSNGGGICGQGCHGHARIFDSWSTGSIQGSAAGGIAGKQFHGLVTGCHSTGDIIGEGSGGICGSLARGNQGLVSQCFSLGEIKGLSSGGILGSQAGKSGGEAVVSMSYSRGNITGGGHAGGVCGAEAGADGGTVIISQVYAAGHILHDSAGGIIGGTSNDADAVLIAMSVFNGENEGPIIGNDEFADTSLDDNSGNIDDILGEVFCPSETACWVEFMWDVDEGELPELVTMPTEMPVCRTDHRDAIIAGNITCIKYEEVGKTFSLVCSEFKLLEDLPEFRNVDFISLRQGEIFEGNHNTISLDGLYDVDGLFRIIHVPSCPEAEVDLSGCAPVIRNLHTRGGEVNEEGGFLVQYRQEGFIVESCSSTGAIKKRAAGGIIGWQCQGNILVTNCSSSGVIEGDSAGGIAGLNLVNRFGHATITHCHSSGEIIGQGAGGICGSDIGNMNTEGSILISDSYSTGTISGWNSGGIIGSGAGRLNEALVTVTRCHSTGEMSGNGAGGLVAEGARFVFITNSYSRGEISNENSVHRAGGILGGSPGVGSAIVISNVYSSGAVTGLGGGLLGSMRHSNGVNISMSVYNGEGGKPMVGEKAADEDSFQLVTEGNSDSLDDITGKLYCVDIDGKESCWDDSVWNEVNDDVPTLRLSHLDPAPNPSCPDNPCPTVVPVSSPGTTGTPYPDATTIMSSTPISSATGIVSPSPSPSETGIVPPSSAATLSPTVSAAATLADAGEVAEELEKLGTLFNFFPVNEGEGETIHDHGSMENEGSFVGEQKPAWNQVEGCRNVLEFPGQEAAVQLDKFYNDKFDGPHTLFIWAYFFDNQARDVLFGSFVLGITEGQFNVEKHDNNDMRYFRDTSLSWRGTPNSILIREWNLLAFSRGDDANPTNLTMANLITGFSETLATEIANSTVDLPHYLGADDRRGSTTLHGFLGPVIIFQTEIDKIDTDRVIELTSPICPLRDDIKSTPSPSASSTSDPSTIDCCRRDSNNFLVDCNNCPEHTIFLNLRFTEGFLPGAFNDSAAENIRILEIRESDFKRLQIGSLSGLKSLETLRISDSSLIEVESGVFKDTPNLRNILLFRNQLSELSEQLLWSIDLDSLDVRGNQIRIIPPNLFQGQEMISLADFRNNHIEFMIRTEEPLTETLFEGIKFVDFFVDGNPGHVKCPKGSVPPFKEFMMENLEEIMGGFCEVPRCEDSARFCFTSLRPEPTCCLVETDSNSGKNTLKYCKCHGEEVIDLSCQGIEKLADGAFDHDENYNVTHINLHSNSLSHLQTKTLSGLPNIHTLIIRNNTISRIDDGSFRGIPSLRHLHLDSNKLTEIDFLTLRGLYNLTTLTVMHNKIGNVGATSFDDTTNIESIYLSHNNLGSLPLRGLKSLPNLLEVELMGNPGYRNCTKAVEIHGNDFSVIHSFEEECFQLMKLEFCFSMTDDEMSVPN